MPLPQTKMQKMSKNKKTAIFEALDANFQMLIEECDMESPLRTAYMLIHDPDTPLRERVDLIKFLAGYVHTKQAQKVEVESTHNVNITVAQQQSLDRLDNYLFEQPMRELKQEMDAIDGELVEDED